MDLILERFNLIGFRLINDLAGSLGLLDWTMIFFAKWVGYLMILYVLWWAWKSRAEFKKIIVVTVGSAIIARYVFVEVIRYFVYSPRPFAILENVNQLIAHDSTSSFPSGHTSFFFALA